MLLTLFLMIPVAMASCEQQAENTGLQEQRQPHKTTVLEKEVLFKESGLVKDHFFGYTPLILRACAGNLDGVKKEVAAGADVNWKMEWGLTALMWAADKGNTQIAEVLINHGADINTQNEDGMTALMLAAREGRTETVELLLKHKADASLKEANGKTAIDMAKENSLSQIVILIEAGSGK